MIDQLELLDRKLFLMINGLHSPLFDSLMFYISAMWIFTPLLIYWLYLVYNKCGLKQTLTLLCFFILLIVLTDQTANRIKHGIKRYRPTHNTEIQSQVHTVNEYKGGLYGFISGHATNSFGVAIFLFLLFNKKSMLFRSSFFLWAAITAYSRIYLGVHYPSDIFVGTMVGLLWGFLMHQLVKYIFKKQFNEIISI